MTTIQEQLFTLLDPLAAGGASPEVQVQNDVYPYIVYRRLISPINNILDGNGNPPINNTVFEVTSWAQTYAAAVSLAALVSAAMRGWNVQNVMTREHDQFESDVRLFRVIQEFSVWHY